ncbi:hypothetical protein EV702DRAFT_1078364 [Suillus placidus]|uniref:Uncharacterized protein n=1 Tax=Suillus placidus TaxID=48579 RepID=A0A9P7D664_9AGAM|nr:hypothetical protein EV702DRAFT_1078364 [Suillus placidus]
MPASPTRMTPFLLIRPWDHGLLELPDDMHSASIWTPPGSPIDVSPSGSYEEHGPVDSERALRLIACLGQPFSAFLLKLERRREYRRVASDRCIVAQFKDTTCVHDMEVRTLEIL